MDALREQDGISVNFLQVRLMSPFPTEEVKEALSRSKRLVDVEMNYSGQFAGLLREMTGISADYRSSSTTEGRCLARRSTTPSSGCRRAPAWTARLRRDWC